MKSIPKLNPPEITDKSDGDRPAEALRGRRTPPGGTRIIAVTSGKGGVGKTNVVANLAVGLADLGKKVIVLDADFGLANIDVLLGLTPRFHLGHVLYGDKRLGEIMVRGPRGIGIIPASSGLQRLAELTPRQRDFIVEGFADLDADTDYFIIDTAAGISSNVVHLLRLAQEVIVVGAPEPTAIVDAYAVIKILLTEEPEKTIRVLINSVAGEAESRDVFRQINSVVKRFLDREIHYLGHVEKDSHVVKAVRSQVLVAHSYPDSRAAGCFRKLARDLVEQTEVSDAREPFMWEKLVNGWIN